MPETRLTPKQWLIKTSGAGKVLRALKAIARSNRTQHQVLQLQARLEELEEQQPRLEEQQARLEEQQAARLLQFDAAITEARQSLQINLARSLARKQDIDQQAAPMPVPQALPNDLNNLYIAFENQFRGTAEEIKVKQSRYLPFLAALAQEFTAPLAILDIGCGRGEWLRLLAPLNYLPRGIDLSQTMVDYCRLDGLEAEQQEALGYLATQPDNSLHVISAFHVIEHLDFEQLVSLFDHCLRVLKPGGKIIFETPNPENITVGAYSFYVDPTHKNPLPPISVEFIARQRGFSLVDIYRYNPREEPGEASAISENWFCCPVDYAIIAQK
ncbi:hypothetical protein A9Q89_01910 [Gammaproteobacteria bacterium 53_120_T64]|nr:hypothetical protein A9Q89_01910 [Gammaproteobacteria bacterium 53_120_T64]